MHSIRPALVLAHRWAGLAIAGFLVFAGLSGSLLAWNKELDAWLYPALMAPQTGPALDPLVIREQLQAQYPQIDFNAVDLYTPPGRAMVFNPVVASHWTEFDQVFVNPYTGTVQGTRMWGDPAQGVKNLMPFVHRLHYSLAAGSAGTALLGCVALLWTLNCFTGLWLTFPLPPRNNARVPQPWLRRWRAAWRVRWQGGFARLIFDLHRSLSLWCWLVLFAMAWSAVSLTLPQVSNPVMRAMLPHQQADATAPLPGTGPRMPWVQARETGRAVMREQSVRHGFTVQHEASIQLDSDRNAFRYAVRSSRDIRDHGRDTHLWFDARSGALLEVWLPTAHAGADTATIWLKALHMAAVWGPLWKTSLVLIGGVLVLTSTTGFLIWVRKRHARST